jgi:hypothetical protein
LTNSLGYTTLSNAAFAVGGCTVGISVVVQGGILDDPGTACSTKRCLPVHVKSIDLAPDLLINIGDLAIFATGYPSVFNDCRDYDNSNTSNLSDLAIFATHFGPPGHDCP